MFTPVTPKTERPRRIRTEREYREWQMALRGTMPVKRVKNEPGLLTRLAGAIRRMTTRSTAPRRMEQETFLDFVDSGNPS